MSMKNAFVRFSMGVKASVLVSFLVMLFVSVPQPAFASLSATECNDRGGSCDLSGKCGSLIKIDDCKGLLGVCCATAEVVCAKAKTAKESTDTSFTGDLLKAWGSSTYTKYSCDEVLKVKETPVGSTGGGTGGGPAAGATVGEINAFCFTQEKCASKDYGGTLDAFVPGQGCPEGQGKCLAPEPDITLQSPVLGVTIVKSLKSYILLMFKYLLSIVVITAAVMFVYGGFKYILASSFGSIESAKETMVNAVIGLVVALGAVAMLNTINPATTNLNRLDIFLVSKIMAGSYNWCSQYPAEKGKLPKFAAISNPAGFVTYQDAKYTLSATETLCNSKYFVEGYGGKTCDGEKCPNKESICISCAGKVGEDRAECEGTPKKSFACMKATFGGSIKWANKRYPVDMRLLAICNWFQAGGKTQTRSDLAGQVVGARDITYFPSEDRPSEGDGIYALDITQEDIDSWNSKCSPSGLRGFYLGVVYYDAFDLQSAAVFKQRSLISNALKGAAAGGATGGTWLPVAGAIPGAVVGGVAGAVSTGISANDAAIIGKNNCGQKKFFLGYANGGSLSRNYNALIDSLYCGKIVQPLDTYERVQAHSAGTAVFDDLGENSTYWSKAEVEAAVKSGTALPKCDLTFDDSVAPSDPGSILMGCCTKDATVENADKVNLWCKED